MHYGLFYKILSKEMLSIFIRVMMYWYSNLHCAVLWKSVLGESFIIRLIAVLDKVESYHHTYFLFILMMLSVT